MKNFRGRISQTSRGHFIFEDSDSEYSDSEVEPVFTPGNFDIVLNDDIILDGEDIDYSTDGDASMSDDDEEIEVILPVEEEFEEDVSMEGFFAFGGRLSRDRRRTRSLDSLNGIRSPQSQGDNPSNSQQQQGSSSTGSGGSTVSSVHSLEQSTVDSPTSASNSNNTIIEGIAKMDDGEMPSSSSRRVSLLPQSETAENEEATTATGSATNPQSINLDVTKDKEGVVGAVEPGTEEVRKRDFYYEDVDSSTESKQVSPELPPPPPGSSKSLHLRNVTKENDDTPRSSSSVGEKDDCSQSVGTNEDTCNPMVSDLEELDENDDALRGDRIGSTTYSERHVLKLLMKWVQELPKYSPDAVEVKENEEEGNATPVVDKSRFLENDFEEEMALLWDMSFESDIMSFLVENNIFNIIRQTLEISNCARLTEISLGIMANILSQQSIVEDFSIHDASLKLVEIVVSQTVKMPNVPVLIQVFAVLRRITWFLRNVAIVQKWMDLLLSQKFLTCANFIMTSCTNVLLLGNVIVTLNTLLETLAESGEKVQDEGESKRGDGEEPQEEEAKSANFFGKALQERKKDFENYRPFCETNFVPSLCEGLTELMKDPKPRKTHKMTSNLRDQVDLDCCAPGGDEPGLDDELPIPDGLVQNGILNGISIFFFLSKTPNGQDALREHLDGVQKFMLDFFRKFSLCTDDVGLSKGLDYFALGINLLVFCIKIRGEITEEDLNVPITTASKLVQKEKDEECEVGIEEEIEPSHNPCTFIALIIHEFLACLAEDFGQDHPVFLVKSKHTKFIPYVEKLINKISEAKKRRVSVRETEGDSSSEEEEVEGQGQQTV